MFSIFRRGSKKKTNNKFSKQLQKNDEEENQNAKDSKIEKHDGANGSSRNETKGERSTTDDHQSAASTPQQQQQFEYPATTIDYVSLPIESIKKSNHRKEEFSEFGTNDPQHPPHAKPKNFRDFFNDLIMAKGRHRNRHNGFHNNNNNNNNQKKSHNAQKNDSKHGYQITDSKNSEKNLEEKKVASEESARASQRCEKFENESTIPNRSAKTVEQSNGNGCVAAAECSEEEIFDNLSELTECDRDSVMGQTNGKPTAGHVASASASASVSPRSSSPIKDFRESKFVVNDDRAKSPQVIPKITVEDFSKGANIDSKDEFLSADEGSEDDEEDEDDDDEEEDDEEEDEEEAADHITPLVKSENNSDSNLSSPDSGYVGSAQSHIHISQHPQFIRDGSSTDCDEHLLHDDSGGSDEILIESISLPDVVVDVEASHHNHLNSCDNYLISSASGRSEEKSVHFVPIKVEKRGSVDDSVVSEKSNGFYTLNNNHKRNSSGVVITAEEDELDISHQKCLDEKKFVFSKFKF